MKQRYEVLKQMRLCLRSSLESFTEELGFSSATYVAKVEQGKINNVEYIYSRYAKVAGIKVNTLKVLIKEAEKNNYTSEEIAAELRRTLRLS